MRTTSFLTPVLLCLGIANVSAQTWFRSPVNGHRYALTSSMGTWSAAEQQAVAWGGHLATIRNKAENAWVTSTFAPHDFWIGLTDRATEGTFVWASGEVASYRNWHPGEPNNQNDEDYALVHQHTQGLWNDGNDNYAFYGLVERSSSAEVLLYDDSKIDPSKWNVVTAGIPHQPKVVEQNGRLELHSRGYLVTKQQFDATKIGPYRVRFRFWSRQIGGDFDRLRVILRGTGVPGGGTGEVSDGLSLTVTINSNHRWDYLVFETFGKGRIIQSTSTNGLAILPNREYELEILDLGQRLEARVTDVQAGQSAFASARIIIETAQLFHVMTYNREALFGPNQVDLEDFEISKPEKLSVFPEELKLSAGGSARFRLLAGPQHSGKFFLLLGSSSGTWPGIPLTPTQTLGLNPDWYFEWCVTKGNFSKVLLNTWGQLDSFGTASKDFTIPPMPGFNLSLDLHHAFVVFNFSTNAPFYADVSYPVLLRIRP